jgi:soluble lytic murein transglycosylase-like protein
MPAIAAPVTAPAPTTPAHTTIVVRADVKTGRLVRSVAVEPRPVPPAAPEPLATPAAPPIGVQSNLDEMIERIALEHGVEGPLVHSVIRAESNYNAHALSPKGAQGIMQLIPATAKRFGVANAFDAEENIRGGVRYLRFLLDYFKGDYARAIAAYNAGEAAVEHYNGIPPYAETQNYVYQVAKNLKAARQEVKPKQEASVPVKSETTKYETAPPIVTSLAGDGKVYYRTP